MPVYNTERYVKEAIESVLNQSFDDFEFIIINDGSTDKTNTIIRCLTDRRIKLIQNKHDFIGSLNLGIQNATSKYIARMDADDIMHIDRLKIQYTIMEEKPEYVVCSSWVQAFSESLPKGRLVKSHFGILKYPILYLLEKNFIFHPSTMIRTDFLRKHSLQYESYEYAEDYKLWIEIAKRGGSFYIISHPLLYYRISTNQVYFQKREEQENTSLRIKKEILTYLVELNAESNQSLSTIMRGMLQAKEEKLLTDNKIVEYFYNLLIENKECFILK